MSSALTARDLGLTSQQELLQNLSAGSSLIGQGSNAYQAWTGQAEQAYSPFTVSTPFQTSVTAGNNAGQQATQQLQNNIAAQPNPVASGLFNTAVSLAGSALGGMTGGVGSILGGVLGGLGGGGKSSSPAPAATTSYSPSTGGYNLPSTGGWSDIRLKSNLQFVRLSPLGYKIYRFFYKGSRTLWEGLMAHEVEKLNPAAVIRDASGFLMVNYSKTDVKFRRA
jgi:hypothetical protein